MKLVLRNLWRWEAAKLIFFLFVTLGTVLVFTLTPTLFPSALISTLLFFIFAPTIDALERKGISRIHGITTVFLVCGMIIGVTASWVAPRISHEIDAFQQGRSRYGAQITEKLRREENNLLGAHSIFKGTRLTDKAIAWITASSEKLWTIAPDLASNLMVCFLLVPFLTFVLLKDAHEIRRSVLKLVPNRYFETVYSLVSRILDEMGGYVAARIIEAALVTILVTLGCLALKIPYAILLGIFAGATNAIPYLGPLLGAVPALFLAILEPAIPNQLLWVSLVYLLANLIDMLVIFPLVVAKIVDLHPVVVVIAVMLGSQLFGVLGMIVAVPITSILKIFIQEIYTRVYNHTEALR
jgi:putative permease